MIKIAMISLTHSYNFGGVLQAYALQKAIEDRYPDSQCAYLEYQKSGVTDSILWGIKRSILGFEGEENDPGFSIQRVIEYIRNMFRENGGNVIPQETVKAFEYFWKKSSYSVPVKKRNRKKILTEYDVYLVGSDQVWNPKINHLDTTYLLDFVPDHTKKFCYAPSFGLKVLPKLCAKKYKKYLSCFQMLSCREETGAEIIEKLTGRKACCVLDPVFLLDRETWLQAAKTDREEKKPYVLVYAIGESDALIQRAKNYAKENGLELKILRGGGDPENGTAGPAEWIGYFAGCSYAFTNSFHGTAFSVLFHKNFYVETGCTEYLEGVSSRILDLLKILGLEYKASAGGNPEDVIDYHRVQEALDKKKQESYAYLDRMMESMRQAVDKKE